MEETNKKKVKKITSKDKKKIYIKRRIIAVSILVLFIVLVVTLIMFLKPEEEVDFVEALISNKYYIKLIEVDSEFKEKGQSITLTRDGDDLVIDAENQTIILKGDVFAQLFHSYKIVAEYPRESQMNNINIGIVGLDKKELISEKEETLNNDTYICKTYAGDIKLYYKGEDIKYIYSETGYIKVLEFEGKVKEELFEIPEDYTVTNSNQ